MENNDQKIRQLLQELSNLLYSKELLEDEDDEVYRKGELTVRDLVTTILQSLPLDMRVGTNGADDDDSSMSIRLWRDEDDGDYATVDTDYVYKDDEDEEDDDVEEEDDDDDEGEEDDDLTDGTINGDLDIMISELPTELPKSIAKKADVVAYLTEDADDLEDSSLYNERMCNEVYVSDDRSVIIGGRNIAIAVLKAAIMEKNGDDKWIHIRNDEMFKDLMELYHNSSIIKTDYGTMVGDVAMITPIEQIDLVMKVLIKLTVSDVLDDFDDSICDYLVDIDEMKNDFKETLGDLYKPEWFKRIDLTISPVTHIVQGDLQLGMDLDTGVATFDGSISLTDC